MNEISVITTHVLIVTHLVSIIGVDMRHYRFNFKKSNLVRDGYNPNKTEKQIMFDRKIYRIYDCGNLRWELTID